MLKVDRNTYCPCSQYMCAASRISRKLILFDWGCDDLFSSPRYLSTESHVCFYLLSGLNICSRVFKVNSRPIRVAIAWINVDDVKYPGWALTVFSVFSGGPSCRNAHFCKFNFANGIPLYGAFRNFAVHIFCY